MEAFQRKWNLKYLINKLCLHKFVFFAILVCKFKCSPMQKTSSDFQPNWYIIVFSTCNERVAKLFCTLHDPLVLSCRFIKQLHTCAYLWKLCVDFSCQDLSSKNRQKYYFFPRLNGLRLWLQKSKGDPSVKLTWREAVQTIGTYCF